MNDPIFLIGKLYLALFWEETWTTKDRFGDILGLRGSNIILFILA